MLTLLAESKTMLADQSAISESDFKNHEPSLERMADDVMRNMANLSPSEIAEILGISYPLAVKSHSFAYDFPHKITGYPSIKGFIGEAFKALDIKTIPDFSAESADTSLRIISSVYGILKPSDIIKPYRCEFNKKICPGNLTSQQYFKSKITVELVNYIKENQIREIINLLPGDADKCIDWKVVKAFATVYKICFQNISTDGKLKTPIANRLKELRGLMCREIIKQKIGIFETLKYLEHSQFIFSPNDSKPGLPVFIASEN